MRDQVVVAAHAELEAWTALPIVNCRPAWQRILSTMNHRMIGARPCVLFLALIALPVVALSAGPGPALQSAGGQLRVEQGHTVGGTYRVPAVRIEPDERGRYTTVGRINGLAIEFLVDTRYALITLNAAQAARLGIDFRRIGTRILASTTSGRATAYRLRLDRVQVGGIQLTGIPARVIDDAKPAMAVLGMSFLGRLRLRHEGRLLILAPGR